MTETHRLVADRDGERLDVFIARLLSQLTRSRVRRLIVGGLVTLEGRPAAKAGVKLEAGQRIELTVPPPEPTELEPEAIPLRIVYEDDDLLVVDKPAGLAVHPSPGHSRHTLVHAILAYCPQLSSIGGEERPGIVHRLDKDTSGLIIVAKHDDAHRSLARQLKERQVEKRYLALVEGLVEPPEGVIEAPIARHPRRRQRMAVVAGGREARTHYKLLREVDGRSLLEVRPETGRTHQIRVHLAAIDHPVTGDRVYGRRGAGRSPLPRHFLHAQGLVFRHPRTGERLELEAPLPEDLARALAALERTPE